jgi:hypothetical protein
MPSIPVSDVITIIYVLVDDWYQSYCRAHPPRVRRGRPPALSVSETLTVMLSLDVVPFPSERGFLAFLRTQHPTLFPHLPVLSQFNRQARAVRRLLEPLRQAWLVNGAVAEEDQFILDTKPVPVGGMKRRKWTSDFLDSASYGYCAARQLHYFGYKLVLLTTVDGLPVVYDLVPAHTDERAAALSVLTRVRNSTIWADKGFIGTDWHAAVGAATGNRVWTPKRVNQTQNPQAIDTLAGRVRQRIEGTFHELQNTGRNLERLLAKTVVGLVTRIATKLTQHLLKHRLRHEYGIDVVTFQADHRCPI